MTIKTKKYQLETNKYITIAMINVMKEFWYAWLVPVVILIIPAFLPSAIWWCVSIALVLSILYILFWGIQFTGVTQHEQFKMLFEKLSYEIDSRQILIKLDAKRGMPIKWAQIQDINKGKDAFTLTISRAQYIYLPFSVFRSEHDFKLLEAILRRKNFLPQVNKEVK